MQIGDRVEIKADSSYMNNPEINYTGRVIAEDDGNIVVRLDEPIPIGGLIVEDFSVQSTSVVFLATGA